MENGHLRNKISNCSIKSNFNFIHQCTNSDEELVSLNLNVVGGFFHCNHKDKVVGGISHDIQQDLKVERLEIERDPKHSQFSTEHLTNMAPNIILSKAQTFYPVIYT